MLSVFNNVANEEKNARGPFYTEIGLRDACDLSHLNENDRISLTSLIAQNRTGVSNGEV